MRPWRGTPFATYLMNIRVAHTAVKDLDLNVILSKCTTLKLPGRQDTICGLCSITPGRAPRLKVMLSKELGWICNCARSSDCPLAVKKSRRLLPDWFPWIPLELAASKLGMGEVNPPPSGSAGQWNYQGNSLPTWMNFPLGPSGPINARSTVVLAPSTISI